MGCLAELASSLCFRFRTFDCWESVEGFPARELGLTLDELELEDELESDGMKGETGEWFRGALCGSNAPSLFCGFFCNDPL